MKRKLAYIAIITSCTILTANTSIAQWEQVGPIQPPFVIHTAVSSGKDLYVGGGFSYYDSASPGGVFHSIDDGISWTDITKGLTNNYVSSLLLVDTVLLAGTYGAGVFRSIDKGISWVHTDNGLEGALVTTLASFQNYIFAGTDGNGIYRSSNNGTSWTHIISPLTTLRSFASIGSLLFAATYGFRSSDGSVYRSDDSGITWTKVKQCYGGEGDLKSFGTTLFGLTDGGGYRSVDSGITWIPLNDYFPNVRNQDQFLAISDTNIMYSANANHDAGIYISSDTGKTWNYNFGTDFPHYSIVNTSKDLITFASNSLYRSTDDGLSWTEQFNLSQTFSLIASHDQYLFAGGVGGVYRSSNNGMTWSDIDTIPGAMSSSPVWFTNNTLFTNSSGRFLRSGDNGTTWDSSLTSNFGASDLLFHNGYLFAVNGSMFRSSDNGVTWNQDSAGLSYYGEYYSIGSIGNTLFIGDNGSSSASFGIYKSVNNGDSWAESDNGLTDKYGIYVFATVGNNIFVGTESGIYSSKDSGDNWVLSKNGLPPNTIALTFIILDNNIIAGTSENGAYFSIDSGKTWSPKNEGFPQSPSIGAFTIKDNYIYATVSAGGLQGSIWRRSLSDFGINSVENQIQPDLSLSLSPNPTTGIITVHNAPANLLGVSILNVLGQTVLDLPHPNAPEFTLDLSKLPPGTYFARFSLPSEVITRKILKE